MQLVADDQQRQIGFAGQPLHLIDILLSDDADFPERDRALDEQRARLVAGGTAIREGIQSYRKVLRRHLRGVR